MVNATINVEFSGVYSKLSPQQRQKGQYAMANQMVADMQPFIPFDHGDLSSSNSIATDGSAIFYNMKYAKAQFYGGTNKAIFKKYKTPGTGKRWDEKAKGLYMNNWRKAYTAGWGV